MRKIELVTATRTMILTGTMTIAAIGMLVGCGKQANQNIEVIDENTNGEVQESEEWIDAPSSAVEERVGKTSFDSYDEIIGLLEGDEAYALVDVKGYDGQVLLITDSTYDNLDGNRATIEATPYTLKSNGKVTADSALFSGGTATPLAIDDEGEILLATHHTFEKDCYGTNGTDDTALMVMTYIYVDTFDEEGRPATVGGFVRTENTVIDNDGTEVDSTDVELFDKMYEDYGKAHIINFTVAQ